MVLGRRQALELMIQELPLGNRQFNHLLRSPFMATGRTAVEMGMARSILWRKRKGKVVEMEDVSRVYELFWDVKRSTQYLMEYQSQYMFNEAATGEEDESNMMA